MNKKITPRKRWFILILLFAIHTLAQYLMTPAHLNKTAEAQMSELPSKSPSGSYRLLEGTQGCPKKVRWNSETQKNCQGFSLHHQEKSQLKVVEFCVGAGKNMTSSIAKTDNLIQKKSWHQIQEILGPRTVTQEDTVIFGNGGSFLWEHSNDGAGFSCLYSLARI